MIEKMKRCAEIAKEMMKENYVKTSARVEKKLARKKW